MLDVDAADVRERVVDAGDGGGGSSGRSGKRYDSLLDLLLERPQLAVGHIEKVAAAAGGVEHAKPAQLIEECASIRCAGGGLDAFPPGPDDRRRDDLHDVGFVRVVSAEPLAPLVAEHTLHEGSENGGVDRFPVELCRPAQLRQLCLVHEHGGRLCKQFAVDIPGARIPALSVVVTLLVEEGEQIADVACGIRILLLQQRIHGVLQRIAVEHAQVLGEQAPDKLHSETLDLVDWGRGTVGERRVQLRDVFRGLGGQCAAVFREHGLARFRLQEKQRVIAIGKFGEGESDARLVRKPPRLPDLEFAEVAGDHETGGGDVFRGVRGLLPVALALVLGLVEGNLRRLHLHDEDARPVQVHESGRGLEILE